MSERDTDGDIDRLGKRPYDNDNDAIPAFGQPAGTADRQAILALVKRYYMVAAAGEGARACSMLFAPTAEAVMEEHRGKGPPSLRGDTCAQIMAKLFEQHHRELTEDIAVNRVIVVQVHGNRGMALMRFGATRERLVLVHHQRGSWKMDVMLDAGSP